MFAGSQKDQIYTEDRECKEETEANLVLQGIPWAVPVPKAIPVSRTDQNEKADKIARDQDWQRGERPSSALSTEAGYLEHVHENEVHEYQIASCPVIVRTMADCQEEKTEDFQSKGDEPEQSSHGAHAT